MELTNLLASICLRNVIGEKMMIFLASISLDLNKQIMAVELGRHKFCVDVENLEYHL